MSLESSLFDCLKSVCARTFPDIAPTTTMRPYVTFQLIGGQSVNYADNTIPDLRNADVQVNVWADTRLSANTLAQQIEDVIRTATTIQARPNSQPMTDYDSDMLVYSTSQDFSIWAPR